MRTNRALASMTRVLMRRPGAGEFHTHSLSICLHAQIAAIDFLFEIVTHFVYSPLLPLGGTHLEPFVITTRGSVSVRTHTVKHQLGAKSVR